MLHVLPLRQALQEDNLTFCTNVNPKKFKNTTEIKPKVEVVKKVIIPSFGLLIAKNRSFKLRNTFGQWEVV